MQGRNNVPPVVRRIGASLIGIALSCLLVMGLTPQAVVAQDTGTVQGTVVDGQGRPLPGAQVAVAGTQRGSVTDGQGNYSIEGVPTGEQTLRAQFVGYKPQTQTVTIEAGETVTADFTLQQDLLQMEEAVVTGSFQERSKMESSVAITTLSSAEIELQNPRSTADLLKAIPGFYVESSGGEGGNNLFARGLPADGSFRYVNIQQNGIPIFESPELAFLNIDQLYRVDQTIRNTEAVRGGTAAIFASNSPAGIVNFVDKTGGQELSGVAKLTGATRGLFRTDFNVGGPIGEDWRFNVGGFYRYDEGVRDPGFPGNQGGQVKANVTRLLDDGYVRVYGTYLNDRNVFYLPIPLQNPDDPEGIDGLDANYGTLTSLNASKVEIPGPNGSTRELDLTDGVHTQRNSLQADLFFELTDDVTLENKARVMQADTDFNAIFSLSAPETPGGFFDRQIDREIRIDGQNQTIGAAFPNAAGFEYVFSEGGDVINPNEPNTLNNLNGNGFLIESGWWTIQKPVSNFTNDLQVSLNAGSHSISTGLYFSSYNVDEQWQFNSILTGVRDKPRLIDAYLVDDDGQRIMQLTENGFTQYGGFHVSNTATANVIAAYIGDEWQATDKLRIDLGGRLERDFFQGRQENNTGLQDLGREGTLADNAFTTGSGGFTTYSFDYTEWAASLGLNYRFSEAFSVFARGSRAFRTPDLDDIRGLQGEKPEAQTVLQSEVGVKYSSPNLAIFANAFITNIDEISFTDEALVDGELQTITRIAEATTPGVEIEARGSYAGFGLNLTATLQNPEYNSLEFPNENLAEEASELDFEGNRVRRVPRYVVNFRPSYTFGNAKLYLTGKYYDERFSDDANNVTLPDYFVFGAGARYQLGPTTLQVTGSNLFNEVGLTEGNPRTGQVVGIQRDIFSARPILGRRFTASIRYNF